MNSYCIKRFFSRVGSLCGNSFFVRRNMGCVIIPDNFIAAFASRDPTCMSAGTLVEKPLPYAASVCIPTPSMGTSCLHLIGPLHPFFESLEAIGQPSYFVGFRKLNPTYVALRKVVGWVEFVKPFQGPFGTHCVSESGFHLSTNETQQLRCSA
ncbi:hypothetical protein [Desulfatibacillum alkenivorans]|uniref:hypothetical protein n=1 Tax=Desulfatibacillum alkenivorans TaxID=259354 RepID=UPI001114EA6B|nr:hypothetical protein [Desulfatibacillum alkenivorans]